MRNILPDHLAEEQRRLFYEAYEAASELNDDDDWDPMPYIREHGSKELLEAMDEYQTRKEEYAKRGIVLN